MRKLFKTFALFSVLCMTLAASACGEEEGTMNETKSEPNIVITAPTEVVYPYEDETLSEKTESYLLSIGVTQTEIDNIRAIMLGEKTSISLQASSFNAYENETLDIKLGCYSGQKVEGLTIDGKSVNFTQENDNVSVLKGDMPALTAGTVAGKLVVDSEEYSFDFTYDDSKIVSVNAYLPLSNGSLTIVKSSGTIIANGEKAVEYGTYVKMNVKQSLSGDQAGGWWLFIGSYGVHFRSGSVRVWTTTNGTNFTEVSPRVQTILNMAVFNDGADISVRLSKIDEKTMCFDYRIEDGVGGIQTGYYDFARIENEIAEENACLTAAIRSDSIDGITITA